MNEYLFGEEVQGALDCVWCERCRDKVRVDIVFSNRRLLSLGEPAAKGYCSLCRALLWQAKKKQVDDLLARRFLHSKETKTVLDVKLKPHEHKTPKLFN